MPSGFTIQHIAPHEVGGYPTDVRLMVQGWILDLAIKAKDAEITAGMQADGSPMRPISAATRRHRHSAMTASGKGSPSAPPLTPAYKLSRTRSLLAGNAYPDRVEIYWRYDAMIGDTWSRILTYQADQGRDVFGLAPADLERIRLQVLGQWLRWTRSGRVVPAEVRGQAVITAQTAASRGGHATPVHATPPGSTDLTHATMGIGTSASTDAAIRSGNWSGGMTEAQVRAFATARAPANAQRGPSVAYNRLLSHVWGGPKGGASAIQPLRPRVPRKAPAVPVATPEPPEGRITLAVSGSPPAAAVDFARKVVESIPDPVHRTLAAKGIKFAYSERLEDRYPEIADERPRGWPEGMTWSHADGIYRPGLKEVTAARTYRVYGGGRYVPSQQTAGVLYHETGHALDHALGNISASERWRSAHARDHSQMTDAVREAHAYLLQPGLAGLAEAFAELFANIYGHMTGTSPDTDAFPACTALIREIVGSLK
jgi:hypothetical protein